MRERKLTRHDVGREQFVSEVRLNSDLMRISPRNFEVAILFYVFYVGHLF